MGGISLGDPGPSVPERDPLRSGDPRARTDAPDFSPGTSGRAPGIGTSTPRRSPGTRPRRRGGGGIEAKPAPAGGGRARRRAAGPQPLRAAAAPARPCPIAPFLRGGVRRLYGLGGRLDGVPGPRCSTAQVSTLPAPAPGWAGPGGADGGGASRARADRRRGERVPGPPPAPHWGWARGRQTRRRDWSAGPKVPDEGDGESHRVRVRTHARTPPFRPALCRPWASAEAEQWARPGRTVRCDGVIEPAGPGNRVPG